jgi:ribose 5-phosphate isomerase B
MIPMKIAIASDHAGFELKQKIKDYLIEKGMEVIDVGCPGTESCDYADYGHKAAQMVANGEVERGILICGTGMGMMMCANRHRGVRAALCFDLYGTRMCRLHNDANVLVLAGRMTGEGLAQAIVDEFFATAFEGGRHLRRIQKLEQ